MHLGFGVNLGSGFRKLAGLLFDAFLQSIVFRHAVLTPSCEPTLSEVEQVFLVTRSGYGKARSPASGRPRQGRGSILPGPEPPLRHMCGQSSPTPARVAVAKMLGAEGTVSSLQARTHSRRKHL